MLVVVNNKIQSNWCSSEDILLPLKYRGDIVITFDPSKTNMAVVIGTPSGTIIQCVEFSGNNRGKGKPMDTTQYCMEVRDYLSRLLKGSVVYLAAIEAAITKKGMEFHRSNMVLTEIRANLLNFFLENYGIKVIEVNNWSWKHAILPEGFRSPYEKGSKKYFLKYRPDSPFTYYFEADITDCLCIFDYVISRECADYVIFCQRAEPCEIKYDYYFMSQNDPSTKYLKMVKFNEHFSIEENLNYYINRLTKPFFFSIDINTHSNDQIFSHSLVRDSSILNDEEVRVVGCRK